MAAKAFLTVCASALLVQIISAQCLSGPAPAAWAGCGAPVPTPTSWAPSCGAAGYGNIITTNSAFTNGGGLNVISSSPLAPSGISVLSENTISGNLDASGNLPVLAAVILDGSLPTCGSAGTTYSCGSGQVGITSDSLGAAGLNSAGYSAASAGAAAAVAAGVYGPEAFASSPCAAPCGYY